MVRKDWDSFAEDLTRHVRRHWPTLHRGAVLMPCIDASSTFALVFANNAAAEPGAVQEEIEQIRLRLHEEEMEDLGFGVSADGCTWTLVVRVEDQPQQTKAGRQFQRELLKIRLADAVQKAWATVYQPDWGLLVRTAG